MKRKTTEEIESSNQSLIEHLVELRVRLMRSLWAILIAMAICYNFSNMLFDLIRAPIAPYLTVGGLVFTAPMDKFIAHLKISFFAGILLSCPFWLYQIWKFIAPGLYSKERKYATGFIVSGTLLFIAGVCFAYFLVFPMAFNFLMNYGGDTDKPMITIDQYLSFFTTTAAMFGLSFELPLIIVVLGMMGVVSQKFLREKRRYAIMLLAIISAILTPPDMLSMVFMLVPLVVLFELSVILVGFFERNRQKSANET